MARGWVGIRAGGYLGWVDIWGGWIFGAGGYLAWVDILGGQKSPENLNSSVMKKM